MRDCYLIDMRNHTYSDHHDDMDYKVLSDDIIRFADSQGLDKFTILGHSMGGRAAMTTACRFPERVDGVICLDAAPNNINGFLFRFTGAYSILKFMNNLSKKGLSRKEAV